MDEPRTGSPYECVKCGHGEYEVGQVRAAGSMLSRIFDVEREKFTAVTCGRCGYTELFRAEQHLLEDMFDFFTT